MYNIKLLISQMFNDRFANIVSSIVAAFGLIATTLWGGWDVAMETLLFFMVFDYITGLLGAKVRKEVSSTANFEGIVKKVIIFVLVAVSYRVDLVLGTGVNVRTVITYFFIGQEGISIVENAAVLGIPVPEVLKKSLVQLQKGEKKDITEE